MKTRRKSNKKYILILAILAISIGYALVSTTLNVGGRISVRDGDWDIHWDDTTIAENSNVTVTTSAHTTDAKKKHISFETTLGEPGDFYEFTVNAKNYGTIAGIIDQLSVNLYYGDGETPISNNLAKYIKSSFTHLDGTPVGEDEYILAGQSITYKFRIEFDKDVDDLPDWSQEPNPPSIVPEVTIVDKPTKVTEKSYVITFDGNGGVVSEKNRAIEKGKAIGILPTASKDGVMFGGWYTGTTDGTQITKNTIPDDNLTYYAHWISSYTTLDTGKNVNVKLKTLAGNTFTTDTPWTEANNNIASFVRSTTAPADGTTTEIISVDGAQPVYAWIDSGNVIRYYTEADTIFLNADSSYMFNNMTYIDGIDLSQLNSSNLTDTNNMFGRDTALTILNVSTLDTSKVTDMNGMFSNCSSLSNLNISDFDTGKVTNMSGMFAGSSSLNSLNLSTWNTSSLTSTGGMFSGCTGLTSLDLSNWDTSHVTNMGGTFSGCTHLVTLKLNGWNFTGFNMANLMMNVTGGGFQALKTFELNNTVYGSNLNYAFGGLGTVENFSFEGADVSNATDMTAMFNGDGSVVTLDLSSFDTHNVTNMASMFGSMANITTITVSDNFVVSQVTSSGGMFYNDTKLVGGRGTVFDSSHIDKEYARYDKGTRLPGYFNNATVTTYTVTFNPSGGEVDPSSKQVYEEDPIGILPIPTKTGFGFAGWYTLPQDGTLIDERTIIESDVTYYAHWVPNKTINYESNGGIFDNNETQNTVDYEYGEYGSSIYSHSSNIDDYGEASGQYGYNIANNDVITIPGATQLTVEVWFSTENYYDWLAIYPKGVTPDAYNYSEATISGGKLTGGASTTKPSDSDTTQHRIFTVNDDTVQLFFRSDSSTSYYGYYAIVTATKKPYKAVQEYKVPSKSGSRFNGWNTESNGTGTTYQNEDSVVNNMNSITSGDSLYAMWRAPYTYTVTLDANGGTVNPGSIDVVEDNPIGTIPTPTQSGYRFLGWYTELTGGVAVDETYIPSGNVRIYAHWEQVYTIRFNANGGTLDETTRIVTAGWTIGDLPTTTRDDDLFFGWYTGITDGIKIESTYYPTEDMTLYARWGECNGFSTASWSTIKTNVESDASMYFVGCTKEVDMGEFGTHTLRVANNTSPIECTFNDYSQTACGFVLEFADGVTDRHYNLSNSGNEPVGKGNRGSWPASEIRAYINGGKYLEGTADEIDFTGSGIYDALPTELKNIIIDTRVITGHGPTLDETSNFTSTDKLYLLSTKEVWGKEGTTNVVNGDTAEEETRQLDYYNYNRVTTSNPAGAYKPNSTHNQSVWLRTPCNETMYYNNYYVYYVPESGNPDYVTSAAVNSVAPAFRISDLNYTNTQYRVIFNPNGGTVSPTSRDVDPGDEIGALPTPTRDGYRFEGWYTDVISGTKVDATYIPPGSVKLYAHWSQNSFLSSTWSKIVTDYNNGDTDDLEEAMDEGLEREIEMDLDDNGTPETYHLRITNLSTPSECSTEGFSQTACGFVLEFVESLPGHKMNPTTGAITLGVDTYGGWEYSDMRAYLNNGTHTYQYYNYNTKQTQTVTTDYSSTGLLSKMPSDLRSNIINTTVVSGLSSYGGNSTTKITTTDKIYLLAPHEIWEDVDGKPNAGPDYYDNAYNDTRQTDYYQSIGVTSSSYSGAIKKYSNGNDAAWWLRNAIAPNREIFALVWSNGNLSNLASSTNSEYGVSPAFRIG